MNKHLARLLRRAANRIDPVPVYVLPTYTTSSNATVTFKNARWN